MPFLICIHHHHMHHNNTFSPTYTTLGSHAAGGRGYICLHGSQVMMEASIREEEEHCLLRGTHIQTHFTPTPTQYTKLLIPHAPCTHRHTHYHPTHTQIGSTPHLSLASKDIHTQPYRKCKEQHHQHHTHNHDNVSTCVCMSI